MDSCVSSEPPTNSKFSRDTIAYAECKGIKLLGWSYPAERNIKTMIEAHGLYPITILHSLDRYSQTRLSQAGMMLCKDLNRAGVTGLQRVGVQRRRAQELVDEAAINCGDTPE